MEWMMFVVVVSVITRSRLQGCVGAGNNLGLWSAAVSSG